MVDKNSTAKKTSPRLIKKYPNRRLYDTKYSQYITLQDIEKLVKTKQIFKVVDAKTGEDLTRSTLLHLIYEKEEHTYPLFTADLLQSVVCFYDDAMHGMFSRYLEHCVAVFKEHQTDLKSPMNSLLGSKEQLKQLHDLAESGHHDWDNSKQ